MISYAVSALSASSRPDSIIFLASASGWAQSAGPSIRQKPLIGFKVPIVFGASIDLYHLGIASSNRYINLAEANAIRYTLGLTIVASNSRDIIGQLINKPKRNA